MKGCPQDRTQETTEARAIEGDENAVNDLNMFKFEIWFFLASKGQRCERGVYVTPAIQRRYGNPHDVRETTLPSGQRAQLPQGYNNGKLLNPIH